MSGSNPRRRPQPGTDNALWWGVLGVILAAAVGLGLVWLAAAAGGAGRGSLPAWLADPAWSTTATLVLALLVGFVLAVGGTLVWVLLRARPVRTRVDRQAKYMATTKDLHELSEAAAAKSAARLGITAAGTGCRIGQAVRNGAWLVTPWEWTLLAVMGPRAGKTTSLCIPLVVETGGPVVATSNKRDLVDHCRGPRSERGRVWVSDPQNICGEPASWWWDPLSFVTSVPGREVEKANRLAGLWAAAAMAHAAAKEDYWMATARGALAGFLLAAAVDARPVTQVHTWANNPDNADDSVTILRREGYREMGDALEGTLSLNPRQRDGVIGSIQTMTDFLTNPQLLPWIIGDDARRRFDPADFVRTSDTIFLLSKEGAGSARAITAALTVAIAEAGEEYATAQRSGRLTRPLLVMLDEAANVCRWPELPSLYSHYGSRGVVLCTILQSYTQGEDTWGREGMRKLWSAANVRMLGKGVAEAGFLDEVVRLVGDYEYSQRSVSRTKGPASVSQSIGTRMILDTADLAALPSGRAVLLTAGIPATLLRLVPWWERPDLRAAVQESNDYFSQTGISA